MLFTIKELPLSAKNSFPQVGVYAVLIDSQGKWLFENDSSGFQLPFFHFTGGDSWNGILFRVKETFGLEHQEHRLVGVGSKLKEMVEGQVFCVFQILGEPLQVPSQYFWEELQRVDLKHSVSCRIIEGFLRDPQKIWVD